MRAERGEEAAMLLSAHQQAAQRDVNRMRQRRHTIRTLIGVFGAVALFVGCIAAVDVFAMNGNGGEPMTLEVTTMSDNEEAMAMEAQFGWSSIGYGWCSMRASTYCMFSGDKEKCKNGFKCYRNRSESKNEGGNGSGSGFGNATVGDYGNHTFGDGEVGSHLSSREGTTVGSEEEEEWGEEGEEEWGEEEEGEEGEKAEEVPQMGGED
ncbi:hypothetical protein P3T76_009042 [Phytophthora citrophthora]|uniref:Uncharacterized protein n=1 Tax=Phytophthora citrophthora TaxID=4793 RepID=A0AAD9GI98_9STRA|nr:hypothetical protein P3T76_009042 [Phytophthora citrophthora]